MRSAWLLMLTVLAVSGNCRIHDVANGRRAQFQGHNGKVATNTWHALKLDATGDHIVVWFDGQKVLEAKDATFQEAGHAGLWTRADSVIQFDAFRIEAH